MPRRVRHESRRKRFISGRSLLSRIHVPAVVPMSWTNAANATTIVIDPPQSDDERAVSTRPSTHYPPPAAATANNEGAAPSGEAATLTPAMQVRMSLLRRLWAATVNMRECSSPPKPKSGGAALPSLAGTASPSVGIIRTRLQQALTILRCS